MEEHDARTKVLADHVRSFYTQKKPFRVYHGGTTSTRRTIYHADQSVDTSSFNHVIAVDRERLTARVEPNVSMGQLVDATLPCGLVPAVVPELQSITVGGCFAGTGGESSSFKQGLFDDTISEVEIILADGRIVRASDKENQDLLRGAAGSFGSLGVLSLLEVRLMEAKSHVEMEYHPVTSAAEAVRTIEELTEDQSVDFLDGILYNRDIGVILAGRWTELSSSSIKIASFHRRRDNWFYVHVRDRLQTHSRSRQGRTSRAKSSQQDSITSDSSESSPPSVKRSTLYRDVIPTRDYLFRYDRGCFWTGAIAFKYFFIHNRRFQRWLLNPIFTTPKLMHAAHKSGLMNQLIIQDIAFPYNSTPEYVDYLNQETGIWPLWLCPLKVGGAWPLRPRNTAIQDRIINIGIWGQGNKKLDQFVEQNRRMEKKTEELDGLKCLYAQLFYTEDEFWRIYNREEYEKLREKFDATSLPNVYDKVGKNSAIDELEKRRTDSKARRLGRLKDRGILRGLYGAGSMFLGGDYLMKK